MDQGWGGVDGWQAARGGRGDGSMVRLCIAGALEGEGDDRIPEADQ